MLIGTKLFDNMDGFAVYIDVWNNATVILRNSTFSNNANGSYIKGFKNLEVKDCLINNNHGDGIVIYMYTGAAIDTSIVVHVHHCLIENNTGTGITINRSSRDTLIRMQTDISNVTFINNSRALYLLFAVYGGKNDHRVTRISECTFYNHRLSSKYVEKSVLVVKTKLYPVKNNSVVIEKCSFKGNQGPAGNYSALYVEKMNNITLDSVDIRDNICTGISLFASTVRIKNHLTISGNYGWLGGAILLTSGYVVSGTKYSQISLTESSFVSNNAETYGGGVFTDETCENRNPYNACFFQFETGLIVPFLAFRFSGNTAKIGGDLVLGGCLSNCSIRINKNWITIDKTDPNNTLWKVISIENLYSQSTLVEYPKRAFFCKNSTISAIICTDSYNVTAFRGQAFNITLMAGDNQCRPTNTALRVNGGNNLSLLLGGRVLDAPKYCNSIPLAVAGALNQDKTTVELIFQDPFSSAHNVPAVLTLHLEDCPVGLKLDSVNTSEQCQCDDDFKSHRIDCHSDSYTIDVPAQIWVGIAIRRKNNCSERMPVLHK